MSDDHEVQSIRSCLGMTFIMLIISAAIICMIVCGCTLSLQNIDTHGAATDLVDDNQSATATPTLTIPTSLLPK